MHEPIKTSTTVDAPYHTDRTHEMPYTDARTADAADDYARPVASDGDGQ